MRDSGSVLPMSQNDPGRWGLRAGQRRRATELLRCARSGRHLPVCDGAAGSWTVTRSPGGAGGEGEGAVVRLGDAADESPYNPLDYGNRGQSVADALLARPTAP